MQKNRRIEQKRDDDGDFPDEIIIDCDVNIHSLDIPLRLILNAQRQPLKKPNPFLVSENYNTKKKKKKKLKKV